MPSAIKSKTPDQPVIGAEYDIVHVHGDLDAIVEFEDQNTDSCFMVDWRGDIMELLDDVNSRLTDREVEAIQPPRGFKMSLACGEKKKCLRSFDRYEILKAISKVVKGGAEELRAIRDSLESDSIIVMVKPVAWWKAMEKHFRTEVSDLYAKFT